MKKFMTGCAITALVLIVAGGIMAAVTGTLKGRQSIHDIVEYVTDGRVQVRLNDLSDWGVTIGDNISKSIENELGEVHFELDDSMVFDKEHEIFSGDVEKFSLGNFVRDMEIEIGGCAFVMAASEDDNYYLEAENTKRFQGYVKEGTLHVRGTSGNKAMGEGQECRITLYVPERMYEEGLNEIDVELGAGVMELDRIHANEVKLEVGAGQITLGSVNADELEFSVGVGQILADDFLVRRLSGEVGMGNLSMKGDVTDAGDLKCAMGAIALELKGARADFNYDLECGMGNISLGRSDYGGMAQTQSIDNNASKQMDVECAMGEVKISFTE